VEIHLDAMAERAQDSEHNIWAIKQLFMRCYIDSRAGKLSEAREAGRQALRLATDRCSPRRIALIHQIMGAASRDLNEMGDAIAHTQRANKLFEEAGDTNNAGFGRNALAMLYAVEDKFKEAGPLLDAARDFFEEQQNPHGLALTLGNRGAVYMGMNELEEADACLWDCLRILDAKDLPRGRGFYQAYLGATRALEGRLDKAEALLNTAEQTLKDSGSRPPPQFISGMRAHLDIGHARAAQKAGDSATAKAHMAAARKVESELKEQTLTGVPLFAQRLLSRAIAHT
jgi:tetratricopeptide (TPR) repeat protein